MAEGTVKGEPKFKLTLNVAEMRWIKDISQNYMGFGNGDDEDADERDIRQDLFQCTHELLEQAGQL